MKKDTVFRVEPFAILFAILVVVSGTKHQSADAEETIRFVAIVSLIFF